MEHALSQIVRLVLILPWLYLTLANESIYDQPMTWPEMNYFCGSCLQSPINVITAAAEKVSLQPLILNNFDKPTNFTVLINDGDTIHLKVYEPVNATVTGGNNDELFLAELVHFHWGRASDLGTEHAVDFGHNALEMQIVNRNVVFGSPGEAFRGVNGFLNLAIFFREVNTDRTVPRGMKTICSNIHSVRYHEKLSTTLPRSFTLGSLFTGLDLNEYFTYCGSYTVPPCTPNVIWIVFPKPLDIDKSCLNNLRSVISRSGRNMTSTQRPLQATGSRKVFYNIL